MIRRAQGPLPVLLAASVVLAAQEPPPAQLEPFRTEVNYIRVDMYPTADGKPVMDLQQDEVEILDEGTPQKIDRFEHVVVRGTRSQTARREPSTLAEMREATQDVRARLFVLFLDTEHVEFGPSLNIKGPLIQALNDMIGGDDLVAVVTAGMQARDLTFRRRTTSIEELLRSFWSERDHRLNENPEEEEIGVCFPGLGSDAGVASEMIFRHREVRTLDSLEELVRHLRFVREERKAVIAISQGWRLFGDDPVLRRPIGDNPLPPAAPLGLDPRTGRLGTVERTGSGDRFDPRRCDQLRQSLSMLRNDTRFLDILREANAGNTSFYPVDPRGLVVFDENIVPISPRGVGRWNPMVDLSEDSRRLRARNDSLRTMAEVTDGLAVVQAGDLSAGMRRIVEDLSSYYLLGYYTTGELDGKFHRLTVRVKRPGVRVRARTGYLAATRGDLERARAAAVAGAKPVDLRLKAVEQSLSTLGIFSRERPLRVKVATGYLPSGTARIWGVGEVPASTSRHDWIEGGQAEAILIDSNGKTLVTEKLTIASGARSLRFAFGSSAPLPPGDYQVQLRAKGTAAPLSAMESVRTSIPPSPVSSGAAVFRRSVTTGNQAMPTADLRFRRTERVSIEVPTTSTEAGTAQLLNRSGQALAIPVAAAIRDDADGSRWRTAQLTLAPLAPGDYVVEQIAGSEKTLTAFRVLP